VDGGSSARVSVKAVLLDADGVIQDAIVDQPQALVRLLGTTDQLPEFMNDIFSAGYQALTGKADVVSLIAGVLDRWDCAGTLDDALELWNMIEVDDDAIEVVKSIRRQGLTICLASNQDSYRGNYMSKRLGFQELFDHEYYSFQIGLAKPDEAYFTHIVNDLNIQPDEAVFIDDKAENVEAAQSVGIQAAVYNLADGSTSFASVLAGFGVAA
jgi:putative hydrolase of the HAD superfamily